MIAKIHPSISAAAATLSFLVWCTGTGYGQCADVTIGGAVYSGTGTVTWTLDAVGEPITHRNPVFAPLAPPLTEADGAKVMIQNMEGGAVVGYGTFAPGTNTWSACVPAGATYIAMFRAIDHDLTSRVFDLSSPDPLVWTTTVDAYLPALYVNLDTGVVDPATEPIEPLGNLLVYAFQENAVNGAPDAVDPGLPGVLLELYDPRTGVVIASGTTAAGDAAATGITTKDGIAIPGADMAGHLYMTDIPPGTYQLRAIPPGHPGNPAPALDAAGQPWVDGFYHTYTMEGTQEWEILIYPGDPGTEAGAYMAWFGFVKKLGQLPPGTGGTTISGTVEDADVAWEVPIAGEPPEAGAPLDATYRNQGVFTHGIVPNAFLVLWRQIGDVSAVIATAEADPVTGAFSIENVPAGTYTIFLSDKPLHWVFGEMQITVDGVNDVVIPPFAQEMPGFPLAILPRFFARVNGFVVDDATGMGIGGATVNLRYQAGNTAFTTVTEPNGWYNFEALPEIETMAMIDVEPPPGYRGKLVTDTYWPVAYVPPDPACDPLVFPNCSIVPTPCDPGLPGCVIPGPSLDVVRNGMNRWVQYYTAVYKSDLILEPVPAAVGQIQGIVFNDSLALGTWVGDGVYDKVEEAVVEGVTVELLDGTGAVIATTTSGAYDPAVAVTQGYIQPGISVPPDEWGGFFSGPMPGLYEFRDVAAGNYEIRVTPPTGHFPVGGSDTFPITVTAGARTDLDIGLYTLVPQAGTLEGGVFADQTLDLRWFSAFSEEKALLVGIGVPVRDHLGYTLDTLVQPSGVCYPGTVPIGNPGNVPGKLPNKPYGAICDRPDLGQTVEIDRLVAPGLRLYWGNDPALPECTGVDPTTGLPNGTPAVGDPPCHNPNLFNLELPYTMGQGTAKYEADWSLPAALALPGGPIAAPCPQSIIVTAMSGSSTWTETPKWGVTISVTVRDPLGFLGGAMVAASWSTGEETVGITNANGIATLNLETVEDQALTSVTAIITVTPPEGVGGAFNGACGVGDCIEVNRPDDAGFILCGVGQPFCGDTICGIGEDGCNCPGDCGVPVEVCDDTIDNDCDGLIDCNDLDCVADPVCATTFCGDGTCDAGETLCGCPADCGPIPAENCTNGVDDDCDGDADCADWDCLVVAPCLPFCGDGLCDSGEDQCNCSVDCAPPPVAACADVTITGSVFSGTGTVTYTMDALGEPIVHRNGKFAADGATPLTEANGAKVMIQDMHGGAIVGYGTFDPGLNTWSACVPAGGTYIAMFSATDHDLTSRVYDLSDPSPLNWILSTEAYLPALFVNIDTGVVDPAVEPMQPLGNVLVYAFEENAVNGAPDAIDPGLPGVLMELYNPRTGLVVASGTTMTGGANPTGITTKDGIVIPNADVGGHLYLTDIPPGVYKLRATPPGHPGNPAPALDAAGNPWTNGWYHTYTMEGTQEWEILIYPGDPGTEAGAFVAWFGFVKKLGQLPAGAGGTSIIGTVEDADVAWEAPIPGEPPEAGAPLDPIWRNQGVSPHVTVPDAFLVLWQRIGDVSTVIATVEADPVTGAFSIDNVPAGTYTIFLSDKPLHWVFGEMQLTVDGVNDVVIPPFAQEIPGMPLAILPRFAARVNGFVVDGATGIGIPGATVNLRYQAGNAEFSVTTDATGWYNFEFLPEIETMAFIDVEPPPGYRGKLVTDTYFPTAHVPPDPNCDPLQFPNCPVVPDPCHPTTPGCVITGAPLDVQRNGMNRWVQYYTANYKSDLILEPIPSGVGQIQGIVFSDELAMGTWVGNELYDKVEESVVEGATIELIDATGHVIATTTSGAYDPLVAVAQGYIQPGISVPPDEWGGFFSGPMPGFYEFRDVAPGDYFVRITPPNGFCAGINSVPITVTDGGRNDVNLGLHTAVPRAGTLEGGVFADQVLDQRWFSAFAEEKQLLVGIGVTVRDFLGYTLDTLVQPSGVCYPGTVPVGNPGGVANKLPNQPYGAICDRPDLGQGVEIDRLVAPGLRLYWGNDPTLPPCNPGNTNSPCFDATLFNLELPYTMKQGLAKYEADWSLPAALVQPFDDCGFLIQGTECVLFQDNGGALHLLDNNGTFGVGDYVQVTGTLDLECVTVCQQGNDCLAVATIAACAAVCGDLVCSPGEDWCTCPSDCAPPINPTETNCADGIDNDCDGDIDCLDVDCCGVGACVCIGFCGDLFCEAGLGEDVCTCAADCGAPPAEDCADGIDNDCDTLVDCLDDDCAADPACAPPNVGVIVASIDSQGIAMEEGKWRAEVTAYVLDGGGNPVPGVQIVYNFIPGETKSGNTDGAGALSVQSETYEGGPDVATFLIISVDHPDYDEGASLTSITINRP